MSVTASLLAALGSVVALAALHLGAGRLRRLPGVPEDATTSLAGGLAVAYVFLHLLPELARGNEEVGRVLGDDLPADFLTDVIVFLIALSGFTILYGMERLAQRHSARGAGETARSPAVFRLHLATYVVYNGIITYSMPLRYRISVAFAVLFTGAMGLHFVITDRGLREHWPERFDGRARAVVAGALLVGWAAALVVAPTSAWLVAALIAFLGGFILMNVFKEELPHDPRRAHFGWFVAGVTIYAALILLVAAAEHGGGPTREEAEAAAGIHARL